MYKPMKLKNRIQTYAWGSYSAIQELLNASAREEPWAELWMGAHPKAASQVLVDGDWIPLDDFIRRFPEKILGEKAAARFNNTLPYLFKVLAAEQPLSIQAHPDAGQAKTGFDREEASGLDIHAPIRNYKDRNHKPECICALTEFIGLKGFRKISSAIELLKRFCPKELANVINAIELKNIKFFFQSLMELPDSRKASAIQEAVESAAKQQSPDIISEWVLKLHRQYPSDIGVLSPLFLNLFCLQPGQALFLPAGELHAYLKGFGIELMANSDNVLRGGLTPKHVDVPELMNVLHFKESEIDILVPQKITSCENQYPVLAEEFELSVIHVENSKSYVSARQRSAEILLCVSGNARLFGGADKTGAIDLKKGDSVFIPAAADAYRITGDARFYKASVPL